MPSKQVTIIGVMTWDEGSTPTPPEGAHPEHPIYYPPHIWGPNDPRPTPPIYLPPNLPGGGTGIWGPTDPRPTNPISGIPGLPGGPGDNPPTNPGFPPGGSPVPPAALVPIDGKLVFIPGYGWMFIPDAMVPPGPPGDKPPVSGAHPDHTLPGDLPHPAHPIELPGGEKGKPGGVVGPPGMGKK